MEGTRLCRLCGIDKPISEYHTRRKHRTKNGQPYVYTYVPGVCAQCEHKQRAVYRATPQGRESDRRAHVAYYAKPEKRAILKAYQQSERGKEARSHYNQSLKGKERIKRYVASEKGQVERRANWARHRERRTELVEQHTVGRSLTARQWRMILRAYEGHCAYCDRDDVSLTKDHVIPLTKGGADTKDNIVPACQECNVRKMDQAGWIPKAPRRPLVF